MADRDSKGRFVKGHTASRGNKGGGRPPRAREERYNEIMQSTCTFSEWQAIVTTAVEQAKQGDWRARKFLADYLLGKPVLALDIQHSVSDDVRRFMRELVGLGEEDE